MSNDIQHGISCFLLDMDGTIYLGNQLIEGAKDFLGALRKSGRRNIFLTNNSSKNRYDYVEKLTALGIAVLPDDIFTSGEATTIHLQEIKPGAKIFLMGTQSLQHEFMQAGFDVITERDKDIDFVVLGFDTTLTYEKIWTACDYINSGIPFYATHPDINCPLPGNQYMPDTGSMIRMFQASTGVSPIVIGKPNKPILDALAKKYQIPFHNLAMVGDRLNTDVMLGKNAGIASILVLSGATSRDEYDDSDIKADYVVQSVRDLLAYL